MQAMKSFYPIAVVGMWCLIVAGTGPGCSRSQGAFERREPPIEGRSSDPAVELKLAWRDGHTYLFSMESTTDTLWQGTGRRRPGDQETVLGMDYKLTPTNRLSNGRLWLDFELAALWVDLYMGNQNYLSFDSESNVVGLNNNPAVGLLYKLIGGHLGLELGPDQRLMRVVGLNELFARLGNDPAARRAGWGVRRGLSYGLLRRLVEMHPLPDHPVRIGDEWKARRAYPGRAGGTYVAELTYKFRGWQRHANRRCARLDFDATFRQQPPRSTDSPSKRPPRRPRPGPTFQLQKGQAQGRVWFDPELGMVAGVELEQHLVLRGTVRRSRDPKAPAREVENRIDEEFNMDLVGVQATQKAP